MPSSLPLNQSNIFSGVRFTLSSSFSQARAAEVRHILEINGGVYTEEGLKDPKLTTVVSNTNRFEGWELLSEKEGVDVVTDQWVERSLLMGKPQAPQHYSSDPAMIFSGVVACASDLPPPDLEVLSAGITALGGQWRTGLTREVTHLFALTPGSAKYATALHFRADTGIRVLLPHWFDDAVRLGMGGLPTTPYEWPEPEILKSVEDIRLNDGKGVGVVTADIEKDDLKRNLYATAAIFTPSMANLTPPAQEDISHVLNSKVSGFGAAQGDAEGPIGAQPVHVWNGRRILLSRTLQLYKGRRDAVQAGVERAGGVVLRFEGDGEDEEAFGEDGTQKLSTKEIIRRRKESEAVAQCDVLVTRWRYGRAYVQALQSGKTVGTLAWLFHVQSTGILTRPLDQLLHYPVPKRPIEAFNKHVITVTNYTGEAREYLKKLIGAMGATFTASMSGQNTVLVAAFVSGTKASKAQAWSIPVVNHTWLEDCFVQWRNLTVGLEKYIVFPPGVDFSALLGERGVGIGQNIEAEAAELAVATFDEDEVGVGVDIEADIPNGTEASMKEVAKGLVNIGLEGDARAAHDEIASSSRSKSRLKVPAGMDIDFEPPSTAAAATNDMDWDVDFDGGADGYGSRSSSPEHVREEPETVKTGPPKRKSTASPTKSPLKKPVYQSKAKGKKHRAVEDITERDIQDKKQTAKARTPTEKSGAQRVGSDDIVELEDSDDEDSTQMKLKTPKKSRKSMVVPSDEEAEIDTLKSKRTRPASKSKSSSPSKANVSPAQIGSTPRLKAKPKPKPKAKAPTPESEDDDEGEVPHPFRLNGASSKPSGQRQPASTDEGESAPNPDPQLKTKKLMRRVTVELEKTVGGVRVGGQGKHIATVGGEKAEEGVEGSRLKKSERDKTAAAVIDTLSRVVPGPAGTTPTSAPIGLLKRTKGDARTRIKKKTPKDKAFPASEGENASEEEIVQIRTKGGKEKDGKNGAKKVVSDDEGEVEHGRSSRRSTKARPQASISESHQKPKSSAKASIRSKPPRVYSTDEGPVLESDSDDELPAQPFLSTKMKAKAEAPERDQAVSRLASRGRKKKTVVSEAEGDEEEEQATKKTTPKSPPKRIVSVLMPSLAISRGTKPKSKRKATDVGKKSEVTGSKTASASARSTAQPIEADNDSASEEQGEEEEVSVLVSPRTRGALAKEESLRVIAGQASTSAKVLGASKTKTTTIKKTSNSISKTRKSIKSKAPEPVPMDVDDETPAPLATSARTSTTPVSTVSIAPPRRNAAAKASQRLHETIMPDVVNFEAQMKKSKGKGRQSGSSFGAFAHGFEEDERTQKLKRKGLDVDDEAVDAGDEDGKWRKKRRVSDENEDQNILSSNLKGKKKAPDRGDDVDMDESGGMVDKKSSSKGKAKIEEDADLSSSVTVMTTQVTLSDDVLKALLKLGVKITTRASECTHLLARQVVRTEKFLCALANAPFILTDQWAIASASAKKLLPERNFLLKDKAGENKYDIDLAQALQRAKRNDGKLLAGRTFYVTPRVPVDTKLLKNVVSACGGQLTTQTPSARIIQANPSVRHVISCQEDLSIWRSIAAQGIKIYSQELLLTGALKQEIEWDRADFVLRA